VDRLGPDRGEVSIAEEEGNAAARIEPLVEHPIAAPDTLIRPWRTATIIASAVAALELVVILGLGVLFLAKPFADSLQEKATERAFAPIVKRNPVPKPATAGAPRLARADTSILVLNGNGRTGAAAEGATRVKGAGYVVGGVGDAPRTDYTRTLVMFRKGYGPEAARLAKDLRLKLVGPLDGMKAAQLHGAHLVLVIGA
jgi:hypothetical protein